MVKGEVTPAQELRTIIDSLLKGLQQMIIEKEIKQETHKQFREKVLKSTMIKTGDRRRLTKARVIDTEKGLQLCEARETADAMKAAKAGGKLRRQKKSPTDGMERPTSATTKKKVVIIEDNGEFHSTGSSTKALGQEDGWSSEWHWEGGMGDHFVLGWLNKHWSVSVVGNTVMGGYSVNYVTEVMIGGRVLCS